MNYPFLKTTQDWSLEEYLRFKESGIDAINFQAQNGPTTKDFFADRARAAGLRAEVWGVTYAAGDFVRDGKLLGEQAVKHGVQSVTMNAEQVAKGTRPTRGLQPIVDGVRAGGFMGPVSLNTLGSPFNPLEHDFAMDTESFLETGGGVAVQAYYNAYPEYHPSNCATYWLRFVPKDRLNLTLGLYDPSSESGRPQLRGADYVPMVQMAQAIGLPPRAISIFLPETMFPTDLAELAPLLKPTTPPGLTPRERAIAAKGAAQKTTFGYTQRPNSPNWNTVMRNLDAIINA